MFHVHELEQNNISYPRSGKKLIRKLQQISCSRSGKKLIRKLKQLLCPRSGKPLIRKLVPISCLRSATVSVEPSTIFHVHEVEDV